MITITELYNIEYSESKDSYKKRFEKEPTYCICFSNHTSPIIKEIKWVNENYKDSDMFYFQFKKVYFGDKDAVVKLYCELELYTNTYFN